ncbi:hypothetical protein HKX48_006260 [Thoreauomyces humboldtii]|nr:hypothetical protein HKX48_006260 [Thoreauomyces humboldtii]
MASTAAGVAVGSTVGHGLSGMLFGGGGSSAPAQAEGQAPPQQYAQDPYAQQQQQQQAVSCEPDQKAFLRCLDQNNDISACQFYLEMLKQCQAAAAPRV